MLPHRARSKLPSLGVALALFCALPMPARAEQPQALTPAAQEAQQLFTEGRDALKKGDLARALDLFRKSQERYPAPGTLLNLANVEEQLGKVASAAQHSRLALEQLAADDERTALAKEAVERLGPKVPMLRVERAAGAPPDMRVKLGEEAVAASSIGVELPLDPGTYTVATSAPGHEPRRYEVKLSLGAHTTLVVDAGAKLPPPAPPPPMPRRSVVQTAGFTLGGVGLAGIGMGAVTGVLAVLKKGEAASLCPEPARCNGQGLEVASAGRTFAAVSTASFIVGLAGLGAGVTMVILGRDRPAAAATIGPVVLAGGAGLGVMGAF
jgi:hypothetical protein